MRVRNRSSGPRLLTRFLTASRGSPNEPSTCRPRHLLSEPRGQDTSMTCPQKRPRAPPDPTTPDQVSEANSPESVPPWGGWSRYRIDAVSQGNVVSVRTVNDTTALIRFTYGGTGCFC